MIDAIPLQGYYKIEIHVSKIATSDLSEALFRFKSAKVLKTTNIDFLASI